MAGTPTNRTPDDSKNFGQNEPAVVDYYEELFAPEDEILREIRERTAGLGIPQIHVGAGDGLHIEVLTRAIGAKKVVEIGTLGGYSGTCIARGLSPGGKLYTLEFSQKHASAAAESFRRAGVADRVEILVGPALENLPKLEKHGPFDLVFIDADKVNYPNYLQWAAEHLREGGVVLGDNTFAWGQIADEKFDTPEEERTIRGLQAFNREVARGGRFRGTILPTGEGLTLGVKVR